MSAKDLLACMAANATATVDIGDNVANSLMLDSASLQYLSRTFGSPTSNTLWTFSFWIKRAKISRREAYLSDSAWTHGFYANADDTMTVNGGTTVVTTAVFRDPAAWNHYVVVNNGTTSTIYRNNVSVGTGTTTITLINSAGVKYLFGQTSVGGYGDAYFANAIFVDGQALTPSDFGRTSADTGQWVNKAYTGTYGNNGFKLDFANSADLGADVSGVTVNDITGVTCTTASNTSVTAITGTVQPKIGQLVSGDATFAAGTHVTAVGGVSGAWTCTLSQAATTTGSGESVSFTTNGWYAVGGIAAGNQYTDTPTNNYAAFSPIDGTARGTISIGNTKSVLSSAGDCTRGTLYPSTGKWYFEALMTKPASAGNVAVGVVGANQAQNNPTSIAQVASGVWSYRDDGYPMNNATNLSVNTTFATGDRIRVAFDVDAGKLWWAINGVWLSSGNPSTGANPMYSNLSAATWGGFAFIVNHLGSSGGAAIINSGAQAFRGEYSSGTASSSGYTGTGLPPTGFSALCTANIPTPAIIKPALHSNAKTRTGTGAIGSVSGELFQPDLVWSKCRNVARGHSLFDSVRGIKQLASNLTSAETSPTTELTSFNSDGFSFGVSSDVSALGYINVNTETYIDWMFKGGGAAVSNTAGSITSSVSANTTAGISIVTYTGATGNQTVGHGVQVGGVATAPKMIIVKGRNTTTPYGWFVYHASTASPSTTRLEMQSTAAAVSGTPNPWASTAPSTTVFSLYAGATYPEVNENGKNYLALCFAEVEGFSKAFSYTGNASTDGVFVYTGFKPRWILIKVTSTTQPWLLIDTARDTYNVGGTYVFADQALVENGGSSVASSSAVDIVSNGFKWRNSASGSGYTNAAQTYIGFAIAEAPMKFSTAR